MTLDLRPADALRPGAAPVSRRIRSSRRWLTRDRWSGAWPRARRLRRVEQAASRRDLAQGRGAGELRLRRRAGAALRSVETSRHIHQASGIGSTCALRDTPRASSPSTSGAPPPRPTARRSRSGRPNGSAPIAHAVHGVPLALLVGLVGLRGRGARRHRPRSQSHLRRLPRREPSTARDRAGAPFRVRAGHRCGPDHRRQRPRRAGERHDQLDGARPRRPRSIAPDPLGRAARHGDARRR